MNVKNGTEKCLDWIFKNNKDKKSFLATITQSTGAGKTYAIENTVCKQIKANSNNVFFVVTNNKENRNEYIRNYVLELLSMKIRFYVWKAIMMQSFVILILY